MTREQCRAARAVAGLSQQALAEVAKGAIVKFEGGKRKPYARTLADIQLTLEARGVQFSDDGVRTNG